MTTKKLIFIILLVWIVLFFYANFFNTSKSSYFSYETLLKTFIIVFAGCFIIFAHRLYLHLKKKKNNN